VSDDGIQNCSGILPYIGWFHPFPSSLLGVSLSFFTSLPHFGFEFSFSCPEQLQGFVVFGETLALAPFDFYVRTIEGFLFWKSFVVLSFLLFDTRFFGHLSGWLVFSCGLLVVFFQFFLRLFSQLLLHFVWLSLVQTQTLIYPLTSFPSSIPSRDPPGVDSAVLVPSLGICLVRCAFFPGLVPVCLFPLVSAAPKGFF